MDCKQTLMAVALAGLPGAQSLVVAFK